MAKTTASQSSHETEEIWVLRVGVVRDRQLVEERLVNFGDSVTIGTLASNLFSLPDVESSVGSRYELFEYRNGTYHLYFTEEMKGVIRIDGSETDLSSLSSGGTLAGNRAVEKRGVFQVALPAMSKGKVEIGEYAFLFQFVSTPAVVVQHKKEDEITSGLEEDDVIFLSFLGFFSIVAAGLVWWIAVQPRPELLDQEEVEELLAEYLDLEEVEPSEEPVEEPSEEPDTDEAVVDPNATKVAKEETPTEEPKPTDKPTAEEKQAVENKATASANMSSEDRAAAEDAVSKSFLFQAIGTVGEGSGVVTSAFGGGDAANVDLDSVLDGVTDGQMAVNDAQMTVKGQIDKSGKATTKVGVVSADGKGGNATVGAGPKTVVPKSAAKIQKIDTAMGTCSDGINKTVRKYLSQVKTCHDISLKNNPAVQGRVEIEVEIMDGAVSSTSLMKNTTGDSKVASCIEKKIRRWKFPTECSDIAVLPFALSPKN
jgi:hypothetical protein